MKLASRSKSIASLGLAAIGLVAAMPAQAADFNERNQLTQSERGVLCLIDSYLTAAAAAVEANQVDPTIVNACPPLAVGPMVVHANPNGSGEGRLGTIVLKSSARAVLNLGTLCNVTLTPPPAGTAQFNFIKLKGFTTPIPDDFSLLGDVFSSSPSLTLTPVVFPPRPVGDVAYNGVRTIEGFSPNATTGLIRNDGPRDIRRGGFSKAKWLQRGVYARSGVFYQRRDDYIKIVTARGVAGSFPSTPSKLCTIQVEGSLTDVGGVGADFSGTFTARRAAPVWP